MRRILFLFTIACCLQAFAVTGQGQGVPTPYTMRLQTFATGLNRPILVRGARDGSKRIFVVQQGGQVRVFQPGATTSTVFIDLSTRVITPGGQGDERGLLGVAFHPQFTTNGRFYAYFNRVGDGANTLAEYTTTTGTGSSNTANISTERVLFSIPDPFSNHNGGMIDFGADGYLYIGLGDGGSANDPGARSQNRANLLGKILRIDVNSTSPAYLIPPTNPFTGAGTGRCDNNVPTAATCQELWAIGMRNPWRWSFDRSNPNQMWVGDVGQGSIEEVDVITTGGNNYGWRVYEGTNCTNLDPQMCAGGTNPITHSPPLFQYSHTAGRCSLTGGYVYRGTQGSLPAGAYVHADYCTGEIWYWNGTAQVLLQDTPRFVVSFGEDDDGEIYVCYSNVGGSAQVDKIVRAKASADVDGDFRSDIAIYRPSTGVWWAVNSSNGSLRQQTLGGAAGDIIVPEDLDGDNITDIGYFRPSSGEWRYFRSSNSTVQFYQWGVSGDIPAAGDYDGDAKADIVVFRPSTGIWYILRSSDLGNSVTFFGTVGDRPVAGDYDGDGKYDIAVYRESNTTWYRLNSTNGAFGAIQWGLAADVPAPGDFDADGRLDIAVFRPSTGIWYQLLGGTTFQALQFGTNNDVPAVGDYDGDGRDDIGLFRGSNGTWYVLRSVNFSFFAASWGTAGDAPVPTFDNP